MMKTMPSVTLSAAPRSEPALSARVVPNEEAITTVMGSADEEERGEKSGTTSSPSSSLKPGYCCDDDDDDDRDNDDHHHHGPREQETVGESSSAASSSSRSGGGCGGGGSDHRHGGNHHHHHRSLRLRNNTLFFAFLVFFLGCGAAAGFLILGIFSARDKVQDDFTRQALDVVSSIRTAWAAYEVAGLHVHQAGRKFSSTSGNNTNMNDDPRREFREVYEYLISTGLEFQVTSYNPNTTHDQRRALESEARSFYREYYPSIDYRGIVGLEPVNETTTTDLSVQPRSEQPFYFPVHYLEPVIGNENAIDFDLYSSASRRTTIHEALTTWKPALTPRLRLVQETDASAYSVILMHPGVPLSTHPNMTTRDFSSMVIRIPDLLAAATESTQQQALSVYIYDCTNRSSPPTTGAPVSAPAAPAFLGGARVCGGDDDDEKDDNDNEHNVNDKSNNITFLLETELDDLLKQTDRRILLKEIEIASAKWTIAVQAVPGASQWDADTTFVILAGVLILVACAGVALWLVHSQKRAEHVARVRSAAEAEKARLIVENVTKTAVAQRELNDFIAHEVRNPLAAAISACTFVKSSLDSVVVAAGSQRQQQQQQQQRLQQEQADNYNHDNNIEGYDEENLTLPFITSGQGNQHSETLASASADVGVIESSLHFINSLLRSMLDHQRASNDQLQLELVPTDIMQDIFLPTSSMLYRRNDTDYKVLLECSPPEGLMVTADRLRVKQIMLNLARNASKFIDRGFLRLRADVVDGSVVLSVEDSGPGIPREKRDLLFCKFQESLDSLNQGTGIGLSLCKRLADLMGATIRLDESYHSGVEGCPGTRFVINLNAPPLKLDDAILDAASTELYPALDDDDSSQADSLERSSCCSLTPTAACTLSHASSNDDPIDPERGGTTPPPAKDADGGGILRELPATLSVLFVDDDLMLRKLFARAIRRVAPGWTVAEASNGETALRMAVAAAAAADDDDDENDEGDGRSSSNFHLIFMDQYMASVEKQLLGTETVRAMRAAGVSAKICGVSANDVENSFAQAGADCFVFKPFPVEQKALTRELLRILGDNDDDYDNDNNRTSTIRSGGEEERKGANNNKSDGDDRGGSSPPSTSTTIQQPSGKSDTSDVEC